MMPMSFSEISDLIATLEAELAVALSGGEAERAAELKTAIDDVTYLRALSLVVEADELVAQLATARASVEQVILRIRDQTTLAGIARVTAGLGILVPDSTSSGSNSAPIESLPAVPPVPIMDTPQVGPQGGPSRYISARKTATKTILFVDDQGREFLRIGGSRSWRNFNPGNIRKGNFSTNTGAIGDDGSFAIFPDKPTGLKAIETLLRGRSYGPLTIEAAVSRYAPPVENATNGYIDFVTDHTGLGREVVLDEINITAIRSIVSAIERMEGWTPGEERAHLPASVVGQGNGVSGAIGASTEWMDIARREAALPADARSEVPGSSSNPRILEYFRVGASWFDPASGDETDWCAVFVNYCLETSGYVGTNHPGARSFFWNKKRQFVRLDQPRKYCIGVRRYAPFGDPAWVTGTGHVGFVVDYSSTHVTLLGGNQRNTVSEKTYQRRVTNADDQVLSEFVAFMMPAMN